MPRFASRAAGGAIAGLPITELQLAALADAPPEGLQWFHEPKLDGYRIVAERTAKGTRLLSRRFKDWTSQFATIAAAVEALACDGCVLDGEVCVVMPDGRTSFQSLQNALGGGAANLAFFVFDLLALDGEVLMAQPLEARKERLAKLLAHAPAVLRYCDHVEGNGAAFFAAACKAGLEGIISKQRAKPYSPGRRGGWQKTKCLQRQEFVVAGYMDPDGARTGIGSLLLGVYADRTGHSPLVYAGKVGTGFSAKVLTQIHAQLSALEQPRSAFTPAPARAWTGPGVHWVAPSVVCEVQFAEWTADGRLRHPSFQGLRVDKAPTDIIRERATHQTEAVPEVRTGQVTSAEKPAKAKTSAKAPAKPRAKPPARPKAKAKTIAKAGA